MAERFHIDSVARPEGILWFTFVYESPKSYYIECYNDSPQPFIKDRLTIIKPADFKKHEVNGVTLNQLLQTKLIEIGTERRDEVRKALEV